MQVVPGTDSAETFGDFTAADWGLYDRFTVELLRRGVFNLPGGRWYLSTAHTADDVERTVAAAREALAAL